MASLFRLGQVLRGKSGRYTITKQIQETVWFAKNHINDTVVIKGVHGHFRVENERNVLRRFRDRTPFLRPLIDEIEDPSDPPVIVLRHLEDNLLRASVKETLNRKELKYISRRILEALRVLHEDGYVHTDVKSDNVLVNYGPDCDDIRFADVQLADLGGTCHLNSKHAKQGAPIGAAIWRSPEALFKRPWTTATDIWSFGTLLISLIYGGDFNLFDPPDVPYGHVEYELRVLMRQFQFFGPFPPKYEEIADEDTVDVIIWLMEQIPRDKMTSFHRISDKEVCKKDKEFIGSIMKLDPRDRPTARELLEHEWFREGREKQEATDANVLFTHVGIHIQDPVSFGHVISTLGAGDKPAPPIL